MPQNKDWISAQGVGYGKGMVKAELMKRVLTSQLYISAVAGRLVLRLPPCHYQLNPMERARGDVKGFGATENKTFQLLEEQELRAECFGRPTT